MKKVYLAALLSITISVVFAQPKLKKSYFGLKGGWNISTIDLDPDISGLETSDKDGFAGGIYYNFGIGKAFSIQPEVLYSSMGSKLKTTNQSPNGEGTLTIDYISVPLLFKITPSWRVGLFIGPQFDFLSKAEYEDDGQKEAFNDFDFAGTAGVELWLTKWLGVYGRYIWGFEDINNTDPVINPLTTINSEIKNKGWQVGLTIGFRGKQKDTDADGIVDKEDKCPADVGIEKYAGCPIPDTDKDGVNDEVDKCPTQVGTAKYEGCPIPDTDKDGIDDEADKCPGEPGTAAYQGCPVPDTDADGIKDDVDKCPSQAGTAKYEGCPVPDTDGDGINDESDKCPSQPGTAANSGCPVADTDGDGVKDDEDKCPTKAGVPEMKGCPKIDYRAHAVTFSSSKAILTVSGKKELDLLVKFLKENPDVKVTLIGYTDASGNDEINQPLSEKRAESAKKYLVSKGIDEDRLASEGRGSANPMEDNKTPAGRAKNRRIEVEVQ